jgi:aspartate/methionine/tyrosine aminotransferase
VPELRQAIAAGLPAGNKLDDDEVLVTHGAAGALSVALDAFVNAGDRVVLFEPASPLFALALQSRRVRLRWVSTAAADGRLRFRLDHFARALRGARLLIVNSPHNPTGCVIAPEDLEQIAWWAERRDVLILSDEVFAPYQYDGQAVSIGALARARRRTLTIGSISKAYGLASARVGWLAAHRHLARPCTLMATLHTPFVPTLCQQIAVTALTQGPRALESIRSQFDSRRRYVFERLEAAGLRPVWPAGAFFFWVPVGEFAHSGRDFARELLKEKNVLVSPGDLFGPHGENHIRVSYAAEDGRLREGVARLVDLVRTKKERRQNAAAAA